MIRQALSTDFPQVAQLREDLTLDIFQLKNHQYRLKMEKKGFLEPPEHPIEGAPKYKLHQTDFEKNLQKIYLVYENAGQIQGYILIEEDQGLETPDEVDWYHPELQELYFSLPHADIGGIVVSPQAEQQGIGTQLLEAAIQKIKTKGINYLFSFVIFSPITNIASLLFHEKNRFERIAIVKPCFLFGMANFQSVLYAKKL